MWDDYVDTVKRLGGQVHLWSILWSFGYLGYDEGGPGKRATVRDVSPSMPACRVRAVIGHFERGTASKMAWDWLARTAEDDAAVVDGIREHA
jgi:hypothetical protein